MIKIPGTSEGLPAITECLAQGINVNVTLLFSVARYREVMDAFMSGLERRAAQDLPIDGIASVASFFVSRLDGKVDPLLEKNSASNAQSLRATAAIANACAAYTAFQETFAGKRWKSARREGALGSQRPLWASTSTKDPALPDVYYVEALIAEQTVNTLPPATFAAYRDHGVPELRMAAGQRAAPAQIAALKKLGIDLDAITHALEVEGVAELRGVLRLAPRGDRGEDGSAWQGALIAMWAALRKHLAHLVDHHRDGHRHHDRMARPPSSARSAQAAAPTSSCG